MVRHIEIPQKIAAAMALVVEYWLEKRAEMCF